MIGFDILRGHKLALATEDHFTPFYMAQSMPLWGVEVIGPLRTAAELTRHIEGASPATVALVSVNLPGLDEAMHRLLVQRNVQYLTFGMPMSPAALSNAARMLYPFTASQIADELAAMLAK